MLITDYYTAMVLLDSTWSRLLLVITFISHFVSCQCLYVNTFQRVTPWNVTMLRNAILNGPQSHPGATHYTDQQATVKLPPNGKLLSFISRKLPSSRGVILDHGKISDQEFEGKIVYRHLKDGDVVLVNRQVMHCLIRCFIEIMQFIFIVELSLIPLMIF